MMMCTFITVSGAGGILSGKSEVCIASRSKNCVWKLRICARGSSGIQDGAVQVVISRNLVSAATSRSSEGYRIHFPYE